MSSIDKAITVLELAAIAGIMYGGYVAYKELGKLGEGVKKAAEDGAKGFKEDLINADWTVNSDGSSNSKDPDLRVMPNANIRVYLRTDPGKYIKSSRQEEGHPEKVRIFFADGAVILGQDMTHKWMVDDLKYYKDTPQVNPQQLSDGFKNIIGIFGGAVGNNIK